MNFYARFQCASRPIFTEKLNLCLQLMLFSSTCVRNCFLAYFHHWLMWHFPNCLWEKCKPWLAVLSKKEMEGFLLYGQEGDVPAWPRLKYSTSFLWWFCLANSLQLTSRLFNKKLSGKVLKIYLPPSPPWVDDLLSCSGFDLWKCCCHPCSCQPLPTSWSSRLLMA